MPLSELKYAGVSLSDEQFSRVNTMTQASINKKATVFDNGKGPSVLLSPNHYRSLFMIPKPSIYIYVYFFICIFCES